MSANTGALVQPPIPPPEHELSCKTAIVGIGESDYGLDYKAQRKNAPGYESPTVENLSKTAFKRALADTGLKPKDIDGLSVSFTFGGPDPAYMAEQFDLKPRYCIKNKSIMAGPLPRVCADIAAGKANTVAMIFAVSSRSMGRQFGGTSDYKAEGVPVSYYYYHPWGWSSQAAHWALMFSFYQAHYGVSEADIGSIAIQLRNNAIATPNAVMQKPMTIDDYLTSRFIVRPLRLFDICMVNDGAVCLIVTSAEKAKDMAHTPVLVAGWGESKANHYKMQTMVRERLRPQMQQAGGQALRMAGISLADIQHFEGYDASTMHLINQLEGFGFTEPGTGPEFCKASHMTTVGQLPVNTSGGNLSGSYMQGWGQVAEVVRQLRHEAGKRQIPGIEVSMSSLVQTDQAHPLIFRRGA